MGNDTRVSRCRAALRIRCGGEAIHGLALALLLGFNSEPSYRRALKDRSVASPPRHRIPRRSSSYCWVDDMGAWLVKKYGDKWEDQVRKLDQLKRKKRRGDSPNG
jgi:hypothetical protein